MDRLTAFLRAHAHPRPARAAGLAVASGAAVAVMVSGCGSAGNPSSGTKPLTARQVVTDAAQASARINSAAATVTIMAGPERLNENLRLQLHPALRMSTTLSGLPGVGNVSEIIDGTTLYLKVGSLAHAGKPWVRVSTSGAGSSSPIDELLQEASSGDLATQAKLAEVVSGVHAAGHGVVDGVPTTRYEGSIQPSAVLPHLSPALRKLLTPTLGQIQGRLQVSYWIDAQHRIRKVSEAQTVAGQHVTTTIVYTAINQPVHIMVPPASQVRSVSSLSDI